MYNLISYQKDVDLVANLCELTVLDDKYTLNDEPMQPGKTYYLKNGDVVNCLEPKPEMTMDDLKWEFMDEITP